MTRSLNVIKIFPESAIKFWSYEYSKRWFARNVDHCAVADISGSSRFVAGGIGGVTSQLRRSTVKAFATSADLHLRIAVIYPLETWFVREKSLVTCDCLCISQENTGHVLDLCSAWRAER